MELTQKLTESRQYVFSKTKNAPVVAMVLGSGLGSIIDIVKEKVILPYNEIPHFPVSTVQGHAGRLIIGKLNGKNVVVMQGRVHFYEGYPMSMVTYPIRLMKRLGASKLILTSAVGGINPRYKPADIVVIKDHINMMGTNPLLGKHEPSFGERFPDMSSVYSPRLVRLAVSIAQKSMKLRIHQGVYLATTGPSYETPSEVKAFARLGGDVVGMSVVPEAIAANQMKMEILALSYVSNLASGISKKPLSHSEVMEVGAIAGERLSRLIPLIVARM